MKDLYNFVLNESNHLKKKSFALCDKPKSIKILRLFLGIGQRDLAKLLSTSQGTIWCLENGRTKKIPKQFLEKIFAEIQNNKIVPISFEELQKKEQQISEKGKFFGDYARQMGKKGSTSGLLASAKSIKPTIQEQEIISCFIQNNIPFERNCFLDFGNVRFLCDFVIPNKINPKFFVEVKRLNTKYRKRIAMLDLAYRALKIKTRMPKIKMITIIDGELLDSERNILIEEYDLVLNTTQQNELLNFILS